MMDKESDIRMENKMLYNILEIRYIKMFGRNVSYDLSVNSDIYPSDWYSNDDYEFKSKVLMEALEKKINISETSLYQEIVEGIRKSR